MENFNDGEADNAAFIAGGAYSGDMSSGRPFAIVGGLRLTVARGTDGGVQTRNTGRFAQTGVNARRVLAPLGRSARKNAGGGRARQGELPGLAALTGPPHQS